VEIDQLINDLATLLFELVEQQRHPGFQVRSFIFVPDPCHDTRTLGEHEPIRQEKPKSCRCSPWQRVGGRNEETVIVEPGRHHLAKLPQRLELEVDDFQVSAGTSFLVRFV
jgi:hypothetical protein